MTTSLYRQTGVSITKKHLPALVTPFANTPKDYNGFLQLLAIQTGHRPITQASAYALEHGFLTKLYRLIPREQSHVARVYNDPRSGCPRS